MAAKKPATDLNMSEAIRALLTENPKLTNPEVRAALLIKYPGLKINKNSFSVAFYNVRKKLGLGPVLPRKKKNGVKTKSATRHNNGLVTLQLAAEFISKVGGVSAALAAIKQVQALQLK